MTTDSLADQFPESPPAERARFLRASGGDAAAAATALQEHLAWRKASLPLAADAPRFGGALPEYTVHFPSIVDCDGGKIFFAQPARIDLEKGSPEAYALATAAMVEDNVVREAEGRCTVVVDLAAILEDRGGVNTPAPRLFSTLRALNSIIGYNYPDRLSRIVIYPVPLALRAVWQAASATLDPEVVAKCVLLPGDGAAGGRMPAALDEFVASSAVHACPEAKAMMVDVGPPPPGYLDGYLPDMSSALNTAYDYVPSVADSKAYVSESLASWRKAIW